MNIQRVKFKNSDANENKKLQNDGPRGGPPLGPIKKLSLSVSYRYKKQRWVHLVPTLGHSVSPS